MAVSAISRVTITSETVNEHNDALAKVMADSRAQGIEQSEQTKTITFWMAGIEVAVPGA